MRGDPTSGLPEIRSGTPTAGPLIRDHRADNLDEAIALISKSTVREERASGDYGAERDERTGHREDDGAEAHRMLIDSPRSDP